MADENGVLYRRRCRYGVLEGVYLWDYLSFARLNAEEAELIIAYFNLKEKGNTRQLRAGNEELPYLTGTLAETARHLQIEPRRPTAYLIPPAKTLSTPRKSTPL